MKLRLTSLALLCLASVNPANFALAAGSLNAQQILQQVRDRDDGSSYATNADLVLIDSAGNERVRKMRMLQQDQANNEERSVMHFYAPAAVRGVSFLTASYEEATAQGDDQWMYLPAFRKVRRIGSNDKRGAFMGSTFNYYDMDKLRVTDYQSKVIGEQIIDGRPCWQIERTPVSQAIIAKTGYHKLVIWVDKERDLIMQQDYFDAKGVRFKQLKTLTLEQVQGIWTVMKTQMTNFDNGRSSQVVYSDVEYSIEIDTKQFNRGALKRALSAKDVPAWSQGFTE